MPASNAIVGNGTLLKVGDGGVGAGVRSFKTWGASNTSIRLLAKLAGTAGNGRSVTVASSGATFVKTSITATVISITVPTTATVAQVIAWLYQDATFSANWDADYNAVGDGSGVCPAQTVTTTAGGTDGTEVFTTVSEISSLTLSGSTQNEVEVTHMESTGGYREKIPTLKDPGNVDISFSYVPSNTVQKGLILDHGNGTKRNFRIILPDGSIWSFAAFVASFKFDANVDQKLGGSISLNVTGALTPPA
jgi:predicted secreted protein